MREILFRAKAINRIEGREYRTNYKNGDWVYGLITKMYDKCFEKLPAEMRNTSGVSGIEVDYKTIGQYTGLKDKNGKKIFEGDIVDILTENEEIGTIVFDEGSFIVSADGFCLDFQNNIDSTNLEVIGNIYDNPELLKERDTNG